MASGDTKTEAMLNVLGNGGSGDEFRGCCNTKTQQYILDAIDRINRIQPGGSYDAGTGIEIADNTISVDTDTIQPKLTAGTGIDITDNTISATGGGGDITVVQTTGNSTSDVMSQNATTSMVFQDPSTKRTIQIGDGASAGNYSEGVAIGRNSYANGSESVCVGKGAGYSTSSSNYYVAIGASSGNSMTSVSGSVSLGAYSKATRAGEVNVGSTSTTYGYNSTNYRVIGGVHDPVDAHDAATKGYVDSHSGGSVTILTASDYNYDSNNDGTNDKIGVWLLSPGVYEFENNTVAENTWYDNANTYPGNNTGVQAITISDASGGAFKNIFGYFGANINSSFIGFNIIVMASNGTNMNFRRILGDSSTIDNLTSTSTWRPLSANQGGILYQEISSLKNNMAIGFFDTISYPPNYDSTGQDPDNPDSYALWLMAQDINMGYIYLKYDTSWPIYVDNQQTYSITTMGVLTIMGDSTWGYFISFNDLENGNIEYYHIDEQGNLL